VPPVPLVDPATLDFEHPRLTGDDLRKVLPHRGGMALVDSVLSHDAATQTIVGYRDVRADEFWCDGHFPGNPLLPGVLMIEAAAQLSIVGYKLGVPQVGGRLIVFGGTDDVRFRGAVRPGDRLVLMARGLSLSTRLAKSHCQALVDGKIVFEGTVIGIPT
jgi:3-hydroxyacyl-[acyl-carrier-protein] dehydratase